MLPQVANTVLNTQFLTLLLRLLKPFSPPATGSASKHSNMSPSSSSGATSTAQTAAHANCRMLAATAIALMLRYATFIAAPSSQYRDEHILPTLTSLLREGGPNVFGYGSSTGSTGPTDPTAVGSGARKGGGGGGGGFHSNQKLDPKLKRRATAALGELIFYIVAQEEGDGGEAAEDGQPDKWVLPSAAIAVLVRCLKDDTDECVRHYAAKVSKRLSDLALD